VKTVAPFSLAISDALIAPLVAPQPPQTLPVLAKLPAISSHLGAAPSELLEIRLQSLTVLPELSAELPRLLGVFSLVGPSTGRRFGWILRLGYRGARPNCERARQRCG
jgi:hypothetical protein